MHHLQKFAFHLSSKNKLLFRLMWLQILRYYIKFQYHCLCYFSPSVIFANVVFHKRKFPNANPPNKLFSRKVFDTHNSHNTSQSGGWTNHVKCTLFFRMTVLSGFTDLGFFKYGFSRKCAIFL